MKVGIIGTGLIGGSLAVALKQNKDFQVYCWNRRIAVSEEAKKLLYVDKYFSTVTDLVKNSDVVVICTPLNTYEDLAKAMLPAITRNSIITDVGSVKLKPVEEFLEALPKNLEWIFVPAHPIAGSEKTGLEAADKELFKGRKLIITGMETTDASKAKVVETMWKAVEANVIKLDATEHDRIYARVSHLPQMLSFAYRNVTKKANFNIDEPFPAYQDFIRLTHSSEAIWKDIFHYNAPALAKALREYRLKLDTNLGLDNIPLVIAKTLNDIISPEDREYGGTGLRSFLRPLAPDFKFNKHEKPYILDFTQAFLKELEHYEKA